MGLLPHRCKIYQVFRIDDHFGLSATEKNRVDMRLADLGFVHSPALAKATCKPLRGLSVQRPGTGTDILLIVGSDSPVNGHDLIQLAEHRVFIGVHQLLRVDGAEHG